MNHQQKKKKQGSPWMPLLIVLLPLLIRAINGEFSGEVLTVLIYVAGIVVLGLAISSVIKRNGRASKQNSVSCGGNAAAPVRKTPEVELHRPVPAMQRREPVTAQRQFPQPEAYCVSCELSGEDHFVRDRKRRIQQLDEWLKNGLIDREEYLVLKNRFERDL